MGHTASIDITLGENLSSSFFESILPDNNWGYGDYGQINYIPLHDKEYDWIKVPQSDCQKVLNEISKKLQANENIGIVITYMNTNIGGQFLYFPGERSVSFNLNVNRQKLNNGRTDFNWYKKNFESLFNFLEVKSIKHIEH